MGKKLSNDTFVESGAGSDIHHIRANNTRINSARNNGLFADLDDSYAYTFQGKDTGCYRDGESYFEPRDEGKGDVARILMYVYMHYSTAISANSSHSYAGPLDITSIVYTSSKSSQAAWNLLMDWNKLDPVDSLETHRNDYCASVTGVRNPFIDHPEFATMIWDSSYSGNGAIEDSGNSSSGGDSAIEEYFYLEETSLNLEVGETYQLNSSTNITNPSYSYTSTNTNVVSVSSNGLITALNAGEATITVSCNDLTDSVTIIVVDNDTGEDNTDNEASNEIIISNQLEYENGTEITTITQGDILITFSKGTSNTTPKYYTSGEAIRAYAKNTINFRTISGLNISKIAITFGIDDGSNEITCDVGNYSDGTWEGISSSVTFTIGGTNGNRRISKIEISIESQEQIEEYLKLSSSSLTIKVGETYQINPETNIINPSYSYASTNTNIASISSNGLITALNAGETTITVSCNDLTTSLVLIVEKNNEGNITTAIETIITNEIGYANADDVTTITQGDVIITFTKGTGSTAPKYYDNGTAIRVYAGNTINFRTNSGDNISKIVITFGKDDGSNEITCDVGNYSNGTWEGTATSVTLTIGNNSSGELKGNRRFLQMDISIRSIGESIDLKSQFENIETKVQLDYTYIYTENEDKIEYNSFGNVNLRYSATISNDLFASVESYGINITIGDKSKDFAISNVTETNEEKSFALVIQNINDYDTLIIATAYVIVNGERIDLQSSTYSVSTMIDYYLDNHSSLGLSNEQMSSLNAFKLFIG